MKRPEAVIFDLDGTLIDSVPDLHAALEKTLVEIGRPTLDLETTLSFVGNGAEALVRRALHATGGHDDAVLAATLRRFLDHYKTQGVNLTQVYPGALDCLSELKAAGIKLGLCTNKPQHPTEDVCASLGLAPFFDQMIGANDKRARKPDPAPLFAVLKGLGAHQTNSLFVGDSVVDHATAAAADVPLALFTGGYMNGQIGDPTPFIQFDDWQDGWWRTWLP